jgi:hypothetical protein
MRQMIHLLAQESIGQRVARFFEVRGEAVDSAVDAGGFAVKLGSQPSVCDARATGGRKPHRVRIRFYLWQTWIVGNPQVTIFWRSAAPPLLELYYVLARNGVSSELQCKPICGNAARPFCGACFRAAS